MIRIPKFDDGLNGLFAQKGTDENLDAIVKFLQDNGYDNNSIAGILGNAHVETGGIYDPERRTPGHAYSGILQNHDLSRKMIEEIYGDYSLQSQLDYLNDWVNGTGKIMTGKYKGTLGYAPTGLRYKKTGYKTPEEAAIAFMRGYERAVISGMENEKNPYKKYQAMKDRVKYANQAASKYNLIRPEEESKLPAIQSVMEQTPKYNLNQPVSDILYKANLLQKNNVDVPYETPAPVRATNFRMPSLMNQLNSIMTNGTILQPYNLNK